MTSLYLLRHGETQWNVEKRFQGSKDSPLTEVGKRQAQSHGTLLQSVGVANIICSTLGRVRETIRIIQAVWQGTVIYDERLRELGAGAWEGLTFIEVANQYPNLMSRSKRWWFDFKSPGGESNRELRSRLEPLLAEIITTPYDLAILTHGAVLRMLLELLLDIPYQENPTFTIENETVFRIDNLLDATRCFHYLDGTQPIPGLPTNT